MCCIDFQDVFFLTQWTQLKTHGFMATSPSSAPSIRCGTVVITLLERGTALNPRVSSSNLRSMFYYSDTNDRHQPPNPLVPNPAGRWQLCDLRQSEWCLELTRYSLQMGLELGSVTLEDEPSGMTDIQYKGTMCLALTYWYAKNYHK